MPGETDLHKTLKKEACRWLFKNGYRAIAAEVRLAPVGIIDAVGTGLFRPYYNYLGTSREMQQVCFIEAKASRADFLRDMDDPQALMFPPAPPAGVFKVATRRTRRPKPSHQTGKFRKCLLRPLANLHYIIAPAGILQKKDLPLRWGLLSYGENGVHVVVRAQWQESAAVEFVESAIARALTGDIYRADARAMNSINREIFLQQQALAERIRSIRPSVLLSPARPQ